ncbi:AAA family ATPase [Nioella nitratireducens]|uniref:AAA family ATPase n=1 Tax=Nioella nitratireducens TaxID=1287720 RepID=UPI0008FD8A01|nr:AAA family ATPase [Nioella nitratireducens]
MTATVFTTPPKPITKTAASAKCAGRTPATQYWAPDWLPFAMAILGALEGSSWAGWRVTLPAKDSADDAGDPARAYPADDAAPVSSAPKTRRDADAGRHEDWSLGDSVDDLLDQIEQATEFGPVLPPFPPAGPAPATVWRPKAATLLAVVRLAASFGSATALATELGTNGALTLLATGSAALDQTVRKMLEQVVAEPSLWPAALSAPDLLYAVDAVKTGSPDRHRTLGVFSDKMRDALEIGTPVVLITPVAGAAPRALRDLSPKVITLKPLDHEQLSVLLDLAYPGQGAADAIAALPTDARVSRLDPDRVTLALRATDPETAVTAIAEALCPAPIEGAGWAAFPMPDTVRAPLEEMISDLHAWQDGRISWSDVARGPLLVGPPGSGKTQVARLIGQEAGIAVVAGSVAQWSSESARSGDMIRAMRAAFATAAEQAPSLLFIDEIDSFGDRNRRVDHNSAYTDFIVTALIDQLDGYHGHEGVIVMAATNHPEKLDKAITRAGRFDRILRLPHPDHTRLPKVLRWHLGPDLADADVTGVAQAALGMSGADIAAAVRAARGRARQARRTLALADLTDAIHEARTPLPKALRRIVSVHEAGHALVSAATGRADAAMLAIQSDGGVTATSLHRTGEDRATIEAQLAISMGGRAAERLLLGQVSAGSGGDPGSDLATATRLATALEASWGLGSTLIWQGSIEGIEARLRDDTGLRARVETHLRNAETRASRILTTHRALLDEMAAALDSAGVLTGPELAAFIARVRREAGAASEVDKASLG